ncbi:hypothetical protein D4764_19G0008940, partial [Takifugu flavidus]
HRGPSPASTAAWQSHHGSLLLTAGAARSLGKSPPDWKFRHVRAALMVISPRCGQSATSIFVHVGVRRGAKTGHFPTDTQPSPGRTVVHLAVKCNSSHCGIKTDSTHNRRRSETRTQAGETGAASGRRGKRSSRRRWNTGTCPAKNEVDHHFHDHPLVEDQSPPNGVDGNTPKTSFVCDEHPHPPETKGTLKAAILNKVGMSRGIGNGISPRFLSQQRSKPNTFPVSRFNVACEGRGRLSSGGSPYMVETKSPAVIQTVWFGGSRGNEEQRTLRGWGGLMPARAQPLFCFGLVLIGQIGPGGSVDATYSLAGAPSAAPCFACLCRLH